MATKRGRLLEHLVCAFFFLIAREDLADPMHYYEHSRMRITICVLTPINLLLLWREKKSSSSKTAPDHTIHAE